jgi:hypothetical protein
MPLLGPSMFLFAALITALGPGRLAPVSSMSDPVTAVIHTETTAFAFVVRTAASSIEVECEQGCSWTALTARFESGRYRITGTGVFLPVPDPLDTDGGFEVELVVSEAGVQAVCSRGCTWESASARSPSHTYRVTQEGLGPSPSAVPTRTGS